MPSRIGKIFRLILAAAIFGIAVNTYHTLWVYWLWAAAAIMVTFLLNYFLLRKTKGNLSDALLPVLFVFGLFLIIGGISSGPLKIFFGALGAGLLFWYQDYLPNRPPLFLEEGITLAAGILLVVGAGMVTFFFNLPWWIGTIFILSFFTLLFFGAFLRMGIDRPMARVMALAGALLVVEFYWVTLFWPVQYLSTAVVTFAAFYLVYMLSRLHFAGSLTRRGIYFQTALALILVLGSLLSSSWSP